jgi:sterol desaturase/sphingolipid hydroxylase (fatty acid hydroxylase superfamily)
MDLLAYLAETHFAYYILLTGFGLVGTWEGIRPLRPATVSVRRRWVNNFLWYILNGLFLRWALPATAVGWSVISAQRGWGILAATDLPIGLKLGLGLLALDLAGYFAHVLLHKSSLLWRLHAVHHSDADFDCTTGFRFHPLEGLFTSGVQLAVISGLGVTPLAVALYAAWLGLQNLYGHANARFPAKLERILHWLVVTPDMHRLHHSARVEESLRNFGIILPWWDRLFRTYQADPLGGHEGMQIGLDWRRQEGNLPELLLLPFRTQFPPVQPEPDSSGKQIDCA